MLDIKKSPIDQRLYRFIELDNKLKCLLICDKDCDKAAAALSVQIGSFQDSNEIPGLAHFLEHMLFLGTEKYSEETTYKDFLSSHGGNCNAFTSSQETNFVFNVAPEYFEGALDIFS